MLIVKHLLLPIICALLTLFANVFYSVPVETPIPEDIEMIHDITNDTTLASSVLLADRLQNSAQAYYTDADRSAYRMQNNNMVLTHELTDKGSNFATLADTKGNIFVADSFDTFYTDGSGKTYYSSASRVDGRVNTNRLGIYYYECNVRDFDYTTLLKKDVDFKVDKTYHLYGDRLYQQVRLLAAEATQDLQAFGTVVNIPVSSVKAVQIRDKNGLHDSTDNFDAKSVEYAAFDIENTGIVGFIFPADTTTDRVEISKDKKNFTVTQYASYVPGTGINKSDETGGYARNEVTCGYRIYTSCEHNFAEIDHASYLERNPLQGITITGDNANAVYLGYEPLRGTYTLQMDGTDFTTAYNNPDMRYYADIQIECDGYDRDIYLRSNGRNGCLEAAAVLDDTQTLVPVNVQVCKNFSGDYGDTFYNAIDRQYGDCFIPLSLKANETLSFTLLNLYQNWGYAPLKQLSSIEFHVSYYHLSTGTTESNCIAPYFVTEKDGWLLPDFRGASGTMWATQPQFNSVGILKFVNYKKSLATKPVLSEIKNTQIDSVGQTYSDITSTYQSDCGSYTYTLRHVEFPQQDENRTFYTVDITFDKYICFDDFKKNFDLFYFDGRFVTFNKAGYLNENNEPTVTDVAAGKTAYYKLGNDCPYFGFFNVTEETRYRLAESFGSNFALLVKDASVIKDGEEQNVSLVFRDSSEQDISACALTLDYGTVMFRPGDKISLDIILLPWGTGLEENDSNVRNVRDDSCVHPLTVTAETGTVQDDSIVPTVRCENNEAVVTLTGGKNYQSIRVDGFTSLTRPKTYVLTDGQWVEGFTASVHGYDGYTVFHNEDGTYGFSFIYKAEDPTTPYTFRIVQE